MVDHPSGDGEPVYLTPQDVLELHGLIIGATADVAANQLRNRAGLEGALARPETYAHYQNADLALQAAVLAHGIAEGQQFIDANKRTALIAMLTFLVVDGWLASAQRESLNRQSLSLTALLLARFVAPCHCHPYRLLSLSPVVRHERRLHRHLRRHALANRDDRPHRAPARVCARARALVRRPRHPHALDRDGPAELA